MTAPKQVPTPATLAALAELEHIGSIAELRRSRSHRQFVPRMLRLAGRLGSHRCMTAVADGESVPCREPVRS